MTRLTYLLFAIGAVSACAAQSVPPVAVVDQAQLGKKLQGVLRNMVKSGSEDFYDAAALVLEATGDESAFLPMMEQAAAAGSSAAQYWVAMIRLPYTQPGTPEFAELESLVNRAVKGKYAPALILYSQLKAGSDKTASMAALMEACAMGNQKARALYLLQTGRLSPQNITLPEVAAELKRNNHYVEEVIANMQQTEQSAAEWMHRAASHGSATASYLLSQAVLPGESQQSRLKHLQTAVARHNVMALFLYGVIQLRGEEFYEGVQKNETEAKRLLQLAAMLGSPDAAEQLAVFLSTGKLPGGTPERIYRLFDYAHRAGSVQGAAGVGFCKVLGAGCAREVQTGLDMMLSARDKGALWVNQALASIYFNGDGGLPSDMRKALDYLTADAAQSGVFSYAIAAGIAALGNADTPPNASMAEFYLKEALLNREYAEEIRRAYDAIILTKCWYCMPVLEKSVPAPEK